MKAILLAAGKGTRLRPRTLTTPKIMLPLGGKPLLEHWLEKFRDCGISEVIINTHYLAGQVWEYVETNRHRYGFKIVLSHEDELLGTGGTLLNNYERVKNDAYFFWCHGDNFTDLDITKFVRFHQECATPLSVALFRTGTPKQAGIIEQMDKNLRIMRFVEKPEHPKGNLASAAIFLMSPRVFREFPQARVLDFSKQVLPLFQARMHGYLIPGFNVDIGTEENYALALKIADQHHTPNRIAQ